MICKKINKIKSSQKKISTIKSWESESVPTIVQEKGQWANPINPVNALIGLWAVVLNGLADKP